MDKYARGVACGGVAICERSFCGAFVGLLCLGGVCGGCAYEIGAAKAPSKQKVAMARWMGRAERTGL